MNLGISSYTYGWAVGVPGAAPARPLDEQDLLDRACRHGVKLVQVCDNLPLQRLDPGRLDAFAGRAAQDGIAVEVGSRGLTVDHVAEMVRLARRVNARLIRFVIDAPEFHPAPDEVVRTLHQVGPMLEGLRLGIENHDRFPAATLRSVVERAGSDAIGICLDTANSLGAGEGLETVLKELGPLTLNLHVKDFQVTRLPHQMGFNVEGRPAGAGMLDIPDLLQTLRSFGRCDTAVLEQWTPPDATLDGTLAREEAWAAQSLGYLKPLFQRSP